MNLFSRFRNLFRREESQYEYDEYDEYGESYEDSYGGYPDAAVEEPAESDETYAEEFGPEDPEVAPSGRDLRMPQGAGGPGTDEDSPVPHQAGPGIHVQLAPIIAAMPLELQSRVLNEVGDLTVFLPLENILPQLSTGAVSLPFSELREAAPEVFSGERDQDATQVDVPLSVILPQIRPDMLARKRGSLQMEIPEDIVSPFADKGRGLAIGSTKPTRSTPMPTPAPGPAPRPTLPSNPVTQPSPSVDAEPQSRKPLPMGAQAAKPVQPLSPLSMNTDVFRRSGAHSSPNRPVGYDTSQPGARVGTPAGNGSADLPRSIPKEPSTSLTEQGTKIMQRQDPTAKSGAGVGARPASPSAPPTGSGPVRPPLVIALTTVAHAWPDSLKREIVQLNLADARVNLPYDVVEAGLKRGRLTFPWERVRSWLDPQPNIVASAHDKVDVEFPLRVVAPAFVAQKKGDAQKTPKVTVDKDIPNLFFGLPQPDTAGVAVDHSVNKPVDTNYYVWDDRAEMVSDDAAAVTPARSGGTEFVTRYATPNEVVSRAAALDGVAGAVIALPDGLMVASQLPPGVNGDTMAAFLPHIFGKVTQCTQELRMGEVNNLNFTVGNVPWKIFRVNALYFAAFGQKGQQMPTARLVELAGELDHKAKV